MNYFKKIENEIIDKGFKITSKDFKRPWGGFLVIDESQVQDFANTFFDGIDIETLKIGGRLSPKILIVSPDSKLSWQYHHRRAEVWRVFKGKVGISKSFDNIEKPVKILNEKDQIKLKKGERHRLIGLDDFAVVSEIWQHTDPNYPSDENDIVRISDDYGR
ncbi:MAG: phosphoheptose isomerase [Bacteroidota bacterium]|nr:phosphoheptose isomerase [Bacteroidota bacterium]MEE2604640.1 phosphoheptose isomerase [Bacteroidota bacterium]